MNDDQLDDLKLFIETTVSQATSGLKVDVSAIKVDVSGLKVDVSSLKADVSSLKTDVSSLKTDVSGLKADVSGLKQSVQRIEQKVDDGFAGIGDAIEETHRHVDTQFSVVDVRLTKLEQQAA